MKRTNVFLAIAAVAIVAIAMIVMSCKKENANVLNNKVESNPTFDPRQIKDMNVYLKEFRQKMTESKLNEAMSLGDAAWHLACLANFDFCRVDVEYNDFNFDTIEMQVKVTDGTMLMSDINVAFEEMRDKIMQFKQGFSLDNQNLYFINVSIKGDGKTSIAIKTTFVSSSKGLYDNLWYFPDTFGYVDSVCDYYFNSSYTYDWDNYAVSELERILNLFEHYNTNPYPNGLCFAPTRSYTFSYPSCADPYGSPFVNDSRVFAALSYNYYLNYDLDTDEMCYCLDSYLGLGYDYIEDHFYVNNEHPVTWFVKDTIAQSNHNKQYAFYHKLKVDYGQLFIVDPNPGQD